MSETNSPRVLMLSCQYMPDVYGGAEKQCRRLLQRLRAEGMDVHLLSSRQRWRVDEADSDRVTRLYTGVAPDLLGRWSLFSLCWFVRACLWAWRRRRRFDLVHCHQGKFGAVVGCVIGRLTGKPVLIKIGNSEWHMDLLCLQRKKLLGPPMVRFILACDPVFVAITDTIAGNLRDLGCRRVVRIANGIEPPPAPPSPAGGEVCQLFYHGRIEAIKRVPLLLEALAIVRRSEPRVCLHLVGDGAELGAVESRVEQLGLRQLVRLHGAVDAPMTLIAGWQVFVNASDAEGLSNSLLEALALGKVLVSTPVSGANDVIRQGGNGFIATDDSAAQLAGAMLQGIELSRHQPRAVAILNRELLASRFHMCAVAEAYRHLYHELHGGVCEGIDWYDAV